MIERLAEHVQEKRVFLSNVEDDNTLACIYSKVNIAKVPLPKVSITLISMAQCIGDLASRLINTFYNRLFQELRTEPYPHVISIMT